MNNNNNNNINTLINEYRENNNQDAFNQIYKQYEKMLYNIIKKVYNIEKEDAFQIACLGLVKAVNTFDVEKEVKFITYATNIIWRDFSNIFKKDEKNIKSSSYDESINDEEKTSILDTIASDINIEKEIITNERIKTLYKSIDKYAKKNNKKKIIIKLILSERTQEDVAEIVGSSRSYVAKVFNEFKKYLITNENL